MKCEYLLKAFLLFYFFIFFILFYNSFFASKELIIDMNNQLSQYETNIDYSNFNTDIKAIAFYLPQFHSIKENDIWWGKGFTEWVNVKKCKPHFEGHHQPRIPGDKLNYLDYYELTNSSIIKKQIQLARSHGIYGFAIYYYWFSGKRLLEKPLDIYLNDKSLDFPFLLIWANENWTRKWDGYSGNILIKQLYKDKDPELFIEDIKKYLNDYRYIKINSRPVIGVYEPFKLPQLNKTITIWKEKCKEYGIGEIFILISVNKYDISKIQNLKLFDGAYDFPPRNNLKNIGFKYKNTFLYNELIYKNLYLNKIIDPKKIPIYRGNMIEWDNCPRTQACTIFNYYSPEKFYMINKIIVEWTKQNYNKENRFIFINAWNEWGEGSYLEPDDKYGYASINSLSKALFNLTYVKINNLINMNKTSKILVQANLYYENLINDIIKFTNNIPVKFDLYISLGSKNVSNDIKNYIENNSKAFNFKIRIFHNEENDALQSLDQVAKHIKKYRYFCHIYSKKSNYSNLGEEWRNYLLNNLLGNSNIISEILTELENKENLGFIYPETFYKVLSTYEKNKIDLYSNQINLLLNEIFPNVKIIKNYSDFSEVHMFWAKTSAIYQIFKKNIVKKIKKANKNLNNTIPNFIDRIWIYIVRLNGFYYKQIFKHI